MGERERERPLARGANELSEVIRTNSGA